MTDKEKAKQIGGLLGDLILAQIEAIERIERKMKELAKAKELGAIHE